MREPRREGGRVLQAQLQVLGREGVARGDAFLQRRNDHHAAIRERRARDFRRWETGKLARELGIDATGVSGIECDEYRHRVGIMLRLREEIARDYPRGGAGVRED